MSGFELILLGAAIAAAVYAFIIFRNRNANRAAPTENIYEIINRVSGFFEVAAHPAELTDNEDFKAGVAIFSDPKYDEQEVVRFAIGDNTIASCMAIAALCEHGGGEDVQDAILGSVGSLGAYSQYYALKFLSKAVPPERDIVGHVLVAAVYYLHYRVSRSCLEEFVRQRSAAGEALSFGPGVAALDEDDLELLGKFVRDLDADIAQPLLDTLPDSAGRNELRAAGRIWSAQDAALARTLVPHEDFTAAVSTMRAALLAPKPQSVLVTGPFGVGKTTIQRLLALDLFEDGWTIFVAGNTDLQAGQTYIGELESRMKRIIAELREDGRAVWFIPDIDRLAYTGTHKYNVESVLDTILPHLESGALRVVAEAEKEAYDRLLQTHPRLSSAFSMMAVPEISREATLDIAGRWLAQSVVVGEPALLQEAWDLAAQYQSDRAAPGNLMSLLQATVQRLTTNDTGAKPALSIDDVIVTLAQQSGLPLELLDPRRELDLDDLAASLGAHVIGQDEAVQCLAERVAIMKAGLGDPTRPIGVFLFAGPTGTGKTEIAKSLARWLFGSEDRLIRIDMSELQTVHSLDRLVGNPDNAETEALTDQIRKQPFSVVLLDEFEKAHERVWDLFLQVFDDARMTDRRGRTASFQHAIIILTANLGATIPTGLSIGFAASPKQFDVEEVNRAIGRAFRREFINRLDRVVVFRPLDRDLMRQILRKEIADVFDRRGLKGRSWAVEWDEPAISFLLEKGFTPDLGARPLKRAVERYLVTPLAETIVRNQAPQGDQFLFISCKADALQVRFVDPAAGAPDDEAVDGAADGEVVRGESGTDTARSILLRPKGTDSELEILRGDLVAMEANIAGAQWQALKQDLLTQMNTPDFWSSPDRFALLGLLEYADRIENGVVRARSLLGRLESRKSADALPTNLLSMFAQSMFLLDEAYEDVVEARPREAFLSVEIPGDGQSDREAAALFANRVADMYEAWAEKRNMRMKCYVRSDRTDTEAVRAVYTVSGYGAHTILSPETGLHVWERPGRSPQRTARDSVQVSVAPQPDAPLPERTGEVLSIARQAFAKAGNGSLEIVRRYREKPSPLVRDSVRGWRTGRIDLVLGGDFDLL